MEITHNIGTQAFYDFNVRHNVLRKEVSLLLCNTIYPPPILMSQTYDIFFTQL